MVSLTRAKRRTLPCRKMSPNLSLSMSTVSTIRNLFSSSHSEFMLGTLLWWKARRNSSPLTASGLPDFMFIVKESCWGCRSGTFEGNFVVNDLIIKPQKCWRAIFVRSQGQSTSRHVISRKSGNIMKLKCSSYGTQKLEQKARKAEMQKISYLRSAISSGLISGAVYTNNRRHVSAKANLNVKWVIAACFKYESS